MMFKKKLQGRGLCISTAAINHVTVKYLIGIQGYMVDLFCISTPGLAENETDNAKGQE